MPPQQAPTAPPGVLAVDPQRGLALLSYHDDVSGEPGASRRVTFEGIALGPGTYVDAAERRIRVRAEHLPLVAERVRGVFLRDLHREDLGASVGVVAGARVEGNEVRFTGDVRLAPYVDIVREFWPSVRFSLGFRYDPAQLVQAEDGTYDLPMDFVVDHLALVPQGQYPNARLVRLLNQARGLAPHVHVPGATTMTDQAAEAASEEPKVSDLFGLEGRRFLAQARVSPAQRVVLDLLLQELEALERVRDQLEHEIAKLVRHDEQVHLLLTVDGIGVMGAATLRAEIDTPDRFPNRKSVRSNFGVATSVRDSADTERRGRITKQGPGVVRKYLGQGALHFLRHNENSQKKHARLVNKRGKGVARMAVAGDVLDTSYQVLKTRTPYKYADPTSVAAKRLQLERLARGPKKRKRWPSRALVPRAAAA